MTKARLRTSSVQVTMITTAHFVVFVMSWASINQLSRGKVIKRWVVFSKWTSGTLKISSEFVLTGWQVPQASRKFLQQQKAPLVLMPDKQVPFVRALMDNTVNMTPIPLVTKIVSPHILFSMCGPKATGSQCPLCCLSPARVAP